MTALTTDSIPQDLTLKTKVGTRLPCVPAKEKKQIGGWVVGNRIRNIVPPGLHFVCGFGKAVFELGL